MEALGWNIRVVWGTRTEAENNALTPRYASKISKHLSGKAMDLIDKRTGYSDHPGHKYYQDLSQVAKEEGLVWGGTFKVRWDPCHVEMP